MAVHRADVLDLEVRVERLVVAEARDEAADGAARAAIDRTADRAEAVEDLTAGEIEPTVGAARAHAAEEARHAADRRCVRAAVVVHDDDQATGVVVADVVERLPGHSAGEGAIADDGHDVAIGLAGHREGARDPVRPAERAGGVRALHDVVLGFGALRVAGEPAALPQAREVLATGQQLVHVALVARVEDHGVPRRVEHAMDRHRQFDHTEVRAEVAAGLGDLGHQEPADLLRELRELLRR